MVANVTQQCSFRVIDEVLSADADDPIHPQKIVMAIVGFLIWLGDRITACIISDRLRHSATDAHFHQVNDRRPRRNEYPFANLIESIFDGYYKQIEALHLSSGDPLIRPARSQTHQEAGRANIPVVKAPSAAHKAYSGVLKLLVSGSIAARLRVPAFAYQRRSSLTGPCRFQ
jgi:hypothetical protein